MVKQRSKSATKRDQVLEAATILFTKQGYAATSMESIAKLAEVSKQTVYSHFGNKEELFSAAIEQKCDSTVAFNAMTVDVSNVQATLYSIAQRFVAMITSKEALAVHKICSFECKTYPQLCELFYEAGPERLTKELTKLMARLSNLKLLAIENPRHAALQYLNMMKGEVWMRAEFNTKKQLSSEEVNEYLSASVSLFVRGYAVKK